MAVLLPLCLLTLSSQDESLASTWEYYAQNVTNPDTGKTSSGLIFSFENPYSSTAYVTVEGRNGSMALHEAGRVDTDRDDGDVILHFAVESLDTLAIVRYHYVRAAPGPLRFRIRRPGISMLCVAENPRQEPVFPAQ